MQFLSDAQTHKGLVRKINEDACLSLPEFGLWAVADGMGGHAAGDIASQLVMDVLTQTALKHKESISSEIIVQALYDANRAVCNFSEDKLEGSTAGTTVVVLFISKETYHVFWAGDSRCYLLRSANLIQLSRDHSQINEMILQGLISESDAENHELSNVITRAIGVDADIEVDYIFGRCSPGDIYLLCTDGLNKEIPDREIGDYLLNNNVYEANRALLHSTLVSGAKDNVTSILVSIFDSNFDYECAKTIPLYSKR